MSKIELYNCDKHKVLNNEYSELLVCAPSKPSIISSSDNNLKIQDILKLSLCIMELVCYYHPILSIHVPFLR